MKINWERVALAVLAILVVLLLIHNSTLQHLNNGLARSLVEEEQQHQETLNELYLLEVEAGVYNE